MAYSREDVYCTLVMSDSYLPGAAVLAHSLRETRTKKKLAVMVTLDTVSADTVGELKNLYDILIPVDRIRNPRPANLYLMNRGDLLHTFTKINLWRQDQFRKIVYLDADVVALRAPDELFNIDAPFAAASDVGWPDFFNTGVMVVSPSMGEYWALRTLADAGDSFDGADQGLLNQYYEHRGWHRLDFTYNCTPSAQYQWEPAYRYKKHSISMVHFIGKEKPWTKPRQAKGSEVYNELLGRWWAVYDRHLKLPTKQYSRGRPLPSTTVQGHVYGEDIDAYSRSPPEQPESPPKQGEPEHSPSIPAEEPLTEPGEPAENIDQGLTEPTPTSEQRKFSMQWDATHNPPPSDSKPEAANFPSQQYEFSENKELFQPPAEYPEPPKDMWYDVPETKPKPQEKPPPIFPWEKDRPQLPPTRIFAEDLPSPPEPEPEPEPEPIQQTDFAAAPPPPSGLSEDEPPLVQQFAPQGNAWDGLEGINKYVRAVQDAQTRKFSPKPQHVVDPGAIEALLSPSGEGESGKDPRQKRRESLILTDFPTADDRPSLPVTPAPIRRPTFWGEERNESGELPAAEGVPDQAEWNPEQKLEELRRNSLIDIEQLKAADSKRHKEIQPREHPRSSISLAPGEKLTASSPTSSRSQQPHPPQQRPQAQAQAQPPLSGGSSPHGVVPASESKKEAASVPASEGAKEAGVVPGATEMGRPEFRTPGFGGNASGDRVSAGAFSAENSAEGVMSPTER